MERAGVDLDSARILAAHHGHADTICFLCQQAVEKMLNALLVARGQAPPRVHELVSLSRLVEANSPWVTNLTEDLGFLSGCYLSSRYPTLDPEHRTREDAERALRTAEEVLGQVTRGASP